MRFENLTQEEIQKCFSNIDGYLEDKEIKWIRYVDLGCKVVKLISYSDEFLHLVEKQLTFVLRDSVEQYDATLILWNEENVSNLAKQFLSKNKQYTMRFRLEQAMRKAHKSSFEYAYDLQLINNNFSNVKPCIDFQSSRGYFIGNNKEKNTYYYGVENLDPEEFIKEGHIFVQFFNNILKTETSNLAHGAVIGLNGDGILMCARGQRGKSTLSVLSMMEGFEYVSDDYLILHQNDKKELLSSPIYSIITLSPKMYNELYDKLEGSRFLFNNARKDKYVINIKNFHDKFRMNYPIKLAIFPEIVTDPEPSIRPCTKEEKGRAMVQMIQSTLMQTQDLCENWTVKKMMNMIKDYPYYKFNLCHNIAKNTEFLRDFMNDFSNQEKKIVESDKIAVDITFDLANILNTETGIIYSMNKFATNIFENLINGISVDVIRKKIKEYSINNENIEKEFDVFVNVLSSKDIYRIQNHTAMNLNINEDFVEECKYKLSIIEHAEEKYNELIKIENK